MNNYLNNAIICLLLVLLTACIHTSTQTRTVWIDVRTEIEYTQDHIQGDLNLPLSSLDPEELHRMFDNNTPINLYCRSGGRAARAKQIFENAGFTQVTNTGGINDARKLRNLPIPDSTN